MYEQDSLLCFGDSENSDFPLLLFFGREYNNHIDNRIAIRLGHYCFKESPRSAFWNRSYSLIARNCERGSFKNFCVRSNQSPVLFSNALPKPIPTKLSQREKRKIREGVSRDEIVRYVDGLFSIPIISRVRIAVLSGLDDQSCFGVAAQQIQEQCNKRQIITSELPYLGSRKDNASIDSKLLKQHQVEICRSVTEFYRSVAS